MVPLQLENTRHLVALLGRVANHKASLSSSPSSTNGTLMNLVVVDPQTSHARYGRDGLFGMCSN